VKELVRKRVVQIAHGFGHHIAVEEGGAVLAWGFGGMQSCMVVFPAHGVCAAARLGSWRSFLDDKRAREVAGSFTTVVVLTLDGVVWECGAQFDTSYVYSWRRMGPLCVCVCVCVLLPRSDFPLIDELPSSVAHVCAGHQTIAITDDGRLYSTCETAVPC